MKLYAATTEYQDLYVTSVRESLEQCQRDFAAAHGFADWASVMADVKGGYCGTCVAEFETTGAFSGMPLRAIPAEDATRRYVAGFREGQS